MIALLRNCNDVSDKYWVEAQESETLKDFNSRINKVWSDTYYLEIVAIKEL